MTRRIEYDLDECRIVGISDDGADLTLAERDTLYDLRGAFIVPGRGPTAMRLVRRGYAYRVDAGHYRLTEAGRSALDGGKMVTT